MPRVFCTGTFIISCSPTLDAIFCICIDIVCPSSATGHLHRRVVVHDVRYFWYGRLFNIGNSSTQRRGTCYPDVRVSHLSL